MNHEKHWIVLNNVEKAFIYGKQTINDSKRKHIY